jgi:hypothetical protein
MQYRASIHQRALTEHVVVDLDRPRGHPSERDAGRSEVAEFMRSVIIELCVRASAHRYAVPGARATAVRRTK